MILQLDGPATLTLLDGPFKNSDPGITTFMLIKKTDIPIRPPMVLRTMVLRRSSAAVILLCSLLCVLPARDGTAQTNSESCSRLSGGTPDFVSYSYLPVPDSPESHSPVPSSRVSYGASLLSTVSGRPHQAFWLVHNRHGIFDEGSANGLVRLNARRSPDEDRRLDWGAGAAFLIRGAGHSTAYFHEGWLEARYGMLRIEAGRKEQTRGQVYGTLSSGSTGMSRNASPVPRVTLSVPRFEPVPLTDGWLEFKGHFSHGWLQDDRVIRSARLHDKSVYLRTGGDTGLKVHAGLLHFAVWGGEDGTGRQLPGSVGDFLRILTAREGGRRAPGGDQVNVLGAHNGLWDLGIETTVGHADLYLYHQHMFNDRSGMLYRNRGDGLYGIGVDNPFDGEVITGLLWEFLYTKHQTGPGLTDPQEGDSPAFCGDSNPNCGYRFNGRDDYYNNYYYSTGWSYHSRALGNPLFLTQTQLDRVDPDIETHSERFFTSTRIVAHHIGLEGRLHPDLSYRLFTTYSRHYGTYEGLNLGEPWGSLDPDNNAEEYFFNPPQHQWHFMVETGYRLPAYDHVSLRATLALDRGDLFNNAGMMAGISWQWQ
ncbi:MAG: capsule assembly Wzi family protein [Balneolaceae bacterium]